MSFEGKLAGRSLTESCSEAACMASVCTPAVSVGSRSMCVGTSLPSVSILVYTHVSSQTKPHTTPRDPACLTLPSGYCSRNRRCAKRAPHQTRVAEDAWLWARSLVLDACFRACSQHKLRFAPRFRRGRTAPLAPEGSAGNNTPASIPFDPPPPQSEDPVVWKLLLLSGAQLPAPAASPSAQQHPQQHGGSRSVQHLHVAAWLRRKLSAGRDSPLQPPSGALR